MQQLEAIATVELLKIHQVPNLSTHGLYQSLTTTRIASQADKLFMLSKQNRNSKTYTSNRNQSLPEAEECKE